ncbi:hypothetical protein NI17_006530 [Thermobifida halotolerans]|uniref:Uncharacterized protein n=1 Tax=Thermobifida halotolerans TaxID=483545 RepID=A0AA97LZG9_9ACTN|nr:DUF6153 family protein [Thermobifida halotolerans]UOE20836.1 hypothetical protein NI17_006530 [Thermobifida halotolerans]
MSTTARERVSHPGLTWARLLLLVALLFGVGAMHTLGHHDGSDHGAASPAVAAVAHSAPSAHQAPDLPGTDPTSMCLAVNGAVVALLSLASVAFLAWPGVLAPPPSWLHRLALRFAPPPQPPSLARLQVLRV